MPSDDPSLLPHLPHHHHNRSSSRSRSRSPQPPPAAHPNGVYKFSGSTPADPQRPYYEDSQAFPPLEPGIELQRKRSDLTANGSDPDGLQDYNKTDDASGKRQAPQAALNKDKKKKKVAGAGLDEVEKDDSYWIHRDKLKEIESRELIEAGFPVGRSSRSNSRSQSASRRARSRKNSELTEFSPNGDGRIDHRRFVSPIPAEDEEGDDGGQTHWDLRTPEEIAAERDAWAASRSNHVIRPSTSRIPIAKTSPAPVPSTYVERDAPLPRPRKGSANWAGDALAINGARVRSGSVSSQAILDEAKGSDERLRTPPQNFSNPTSAATRSPMKSKTPAKPNPTSGGRKASAQKSTLQTRTRNTSANSPNKRPGTSGGSISRPLTGTRPEGEAPWIATMYKPDPRLPPDQQIIPTHAKRMQQEQWETEGKTASLYGPDFRQLNADEFKNNRRPSQNQLSDTEKPSEDQQWPLPSPTKAGPERSDLLVRSPTNEQGNYKLTPTIPQSPRAPSRAPSRAASRRSEERRVGKECPV